MDMENIPHWITDTECAPWTYGFTDISSSLFLSCITHSIEYPAFFNALYSPSV